MTRLATPTSRLFDSMRVEGPILPPGAPEGVPARVHESSYFGHDALVRLGWPDGALVTARPPGHAVPADGDEVRLVVRGPVHALRG